MKRVIGICLVTLGVTSGLSSLFFFDLYSSIRPTSPRPADAQIVEKEHKGHIFFISKSDDNFLWHLTLGAVLLLGIGGLLLKEK
jgi:hypothetical protein